MECIGGCRRCNSGTGTRYRDARNRLSSGDNGVRSCSISTSTSTSNGSGNGLTLSWHRTRDSSCSDSIRHRWYSRRDGVLHSDVGSVEVKNEFT